MATIAFRLTWATAEPSPSLVAAAGGTEVATLLDWSTAMGTVGAVVVALAFGIVAERRTRQDRRDRAAEVARARESARRSQAERVAIWAHEDTSRIDEHTGHPAVSIHVLNASDLPVSRVHVPGNDVWRGWSPQSLLPGETKRADLLYEELAAFPGDRESTLHVVFMDNAGYAWARSFDGELWELSQSD